MMADPLFYYVYWEQMYDEYAPVGFYSTLDKAREAISLDDGVPIDQVVQDPVDDSWNAYYHIEPVYHLDEMPVSKLERMARLKATQYKWGWSK